MKELTEKYAKDDSKLYKDLYTYNRKFILSN